MVTEAKFMLVNSTIMMNETGDFKELSASIRFEVEDTVYGDVKAKKILLFPATATDVVALNDVTHQHTEYMTEFDSFIDELDGTVRVMNMMLGDELVVTFELFPYVDVVDVDLDAFVSDFISYCAETRHSA